MRTHCLIAAALALSTFSTANAAPRSLSMPQENPVQTAPDAAKPVEAPGVQGAVDR